MCVCVFFFGGPRLRTCSIQSVNLIALANAWFEGRPRFVCNFDTAILTALTDADMEALDSILDSNALPGSAFIEVALEPVLDEGL